MKTVTTNSGEAEENTKENIKTKTNKKQDRVMWKAGTIRRTGREGGLSFGAPSLVGLMGKVYPF